MIFWLAISFIFGIIWYILYKKQSKSVKLASNPPQYDHAIIVGGSIKVMATAAYLTKYFKRIKTIESHDVLNDTLTKSTLSELLYHRCRLVSPSSVGRSGIGQIFQLHVIACEGYQL